MKDAAARLNFGLARKLIRPEEAARKVRSNDTIVINGFIAQGAPEELIKALANRYEKEHYPENLTLLMGCGPGDFVSQGVNRLAERPGLLKRVIGAHYGQVPFITKRVLNEEIPAYALPLGAISRMIRSAASHTPFHVTQAGLETFVDPRYGGGCLNDLARKSGNKLVELYVDEVGGEYLKFNTIPIRVAFLRATTADLHGNLTMEHESLLGDTRVMANAVRASGGTVIAQVSRIAEANSLDSRDVHVPGSLVDFIVHAPNQQMSYFVNYNPATSGEIRIPVRAATNGEDAEICNKERMIIARRAAKELQLHDIINLGVGMPEGVAQVAREENVLEHLTITTEAGVVGGEAYGGHEFGPGFNYQALVEMNEQFDFYSGGGLNCSFLGMGQVGANGNVNVSRLSKDKITGPGGFMDIVQNTRKIVFMGTFLKKNGQVRTFQETSGLETTFSGPRGLIAGQEVIYVTERAVFSLNYRGLKLEEVAPNINLQKDVLDHMGFVPHGTDSFTRMDSAIFELQTSLELEDQFFSLDKVFDRRITKYGDTILVDLSNLPLLSVKAISEFTNTIAEKCYLSQKTDPKEQIKTVVIKWDHMRIPLALQELSQKTLKNRIHEKLSSHVDVKYWRSFVGISEEGQLDILWKDFKGSGKTVLSRTQIRKYLEKSFKLRLMHTQLNFLMDGQVVIEEKDFPAFVARIRQFLLW